MKKLITDNAISRLKINDEIRDTKTQGLNVRRLKGSISFTLTKKVGAKRHRITLGQYPAMSIDEAREAAYRELRLLEGRSDIEAAKQTLDQFFAWYLDSKYFLLLSKNWQGEVKAKYKGLVSPRIGHLRISQVRRVQVIDALDEIVLASGPAAANHCKSIVSRLFKLAVERNVLLANPIAGLPKPGKVKSRERVATEEEIVKLWHGTNNIDPSHVLFKLMLISGQRAGELKTLKWEHIDGEWINLYDTKNGDSHQAYIGELGLELLSRLKRTNEYVFPAARSDAEEEYMTNHTTSWTRLRKQLGIEGLTAHDLRRTMATGVGELTANETLCARILNHRKSDTTSIYVRSTFKTRMQEGVVLWHERLRQLVYGEKAKVLAFAAEA